MLNNCEPVARWRRYGEEANDQADGLIIRKIAGATFVAGVNIRTVLLKPIAKN
jgi:hypothetical protein